MGKSMMVNHKKMVGWLTRFSLDDLAGYLHFGKPPENQEKQVLTTDGSFINYDDSA